MSRVLRRPASALAVAWLVVISVACAGASVVAPYNYNRQDLLNIYSGPSVSHWLGTDILGRDILSRILYGGRVTLVGLLVAVGIYLAVGIPLGLVSGYFSGRSDRLIMRLCDLMFSIPSIILILVILTVFGNDETAAMIALGVLGSPGLVRVLRGNTKVIREQVFVRAARVSGLRELQILRLHVLPRLLGPIIVQASLFGAAAILTETGLGFLGLGVQPPTPTWGNLISDASQAVDRDPWFLLPTGGVIFLTILALGLLGDALRDESGARRAGANRVALRGTVVKSTNPGPADGETKPAPTESVVLSIRGLTVAYPLNGNFTPVVANLDLDIARGEVMGLVGESGSGKSVTALAVLGLLRGQGTIQAGTARFEGTDILQLSKADAAALRGSDIGFVSQEPVASLDPTFTVGSQLTELIRHHHETDRRAARQRAIELVSEVQLPEPENVLDRYPHQLSGGMAQRVGIALALAGDPILLVADEPTSALDVTTQAEILELLRRLQESRSMSVLLITHDFGVVSRTCDRVTVMYAGQVVEQATASDLLRSPRSPYTKALLEARPTGTIRRHRLVAIPGVVPPADQWPSGCHFQDRCQHVAGDCRAAPVELVEVSNGHRARCLHSSQLTRKATAEL